MNNERDSGGELTCCASAKAILPLNISEYLAMAAS
jgi:hypothetical protein